MNLLLVQMNFHMAHVPGIDDSYPIGLGYLDASLTEAGHSVTTLQLSELAQDDAN